MYLNKLPVFYTIDIATAFQAGQFLNNISAKETQEALYQYQIDIYLGSLDIVISDTSINFDFTEFWTKVKMLDIIYYQILVETHWLIEKVEKYYAPIYHAYDIILAETEDIISKNAVLQIAFKAINDTAALDNLIPTLFIFDAYPRIVIDSPFSLL